MTELMSVSTESIPARHAARVVLLDEQNRTLLLRYDERGQRFWALPGGTLEPGESHADAARRELAEELGVHDLALSPPIAVRDTGRESEPRVLEKYFTARLNSADVDAGSPTQPDQIRGHGWWTTAELRQTNEIVYPTALADVTLTLIDDGVPATPIQLRA